MHEFSVAESLVETVAGEARRAGATRVKKVFCRVGALTHIDSDILCEVFGFAAENTVCAGAELVIEKTHMEATCPQCGGRFEVKQWEWLCPHCGRAGIDAEGGDEIVLVSIEAEVPDEDRSSEERVRQE